MASCVPDGRFRCGYTRGPTTEQAYGDNPFFPGVSHCRRRTTSRHRSRGPPRAPTTPSAPSKARKRWRRSAAKTRRSHVFSWGYLSQPDVPYLVGSPSIIRNTHHRLRFLTFLSRLSPPRFSPPLACLAQRTRRPRRSRRFAQRCLAWPERDPGLATGPQRLG